MTSSKRTQAARLDQLREEIACAIACKKAYDVPALCVKLGLLAQATQEDQDLAFRSKRGHVRPMLRDKAEPDLLSLAQVVLDEVDYAPLELLFTEMTQHGERRVSKVVRKDVLQALSGVDRLFGDQPILETIEKIFGAQAVSGELLFGMFSGRHAGPITQHYLRNPDWSHQQMLEHCGALDCPQTTFFRLIETVLDPLIRRDQEQAELAEAVSQCLQRDGFAVKATSWQSGYPVFTIVRATPGVAGAMKNLIFASIGAKPDIVIRDAVSNDVEIVRNADKVLVFEKALPSGLLSWADLQAWWAEKMDITDAFQAKKTLYKRLLQSVKQSGSPGELAMFRAYFEHFGRLEPASLPALLPQVYLHYDPYTKRERGQEQVLARQRMDFLLLLASGVRIVLEIDGQHHYGDSEADGRFRASASKYAAMAAEDRRLRLAGYEVYRFGAGELQLQPGSQEELTADALAIIVNFFKALFRRHGLAMVE